MPLLAVEAAKLSIEDRQRGIIEEIIDRDEFFALVPFAGVKDETYSYVREKTQAQGSWFSAYEDLEESASDFTPVSVQLKRLAGQVDIDNFMDEVQSSINPQTAIQLQQKAKGLGRQFRDAIVNGDSSVNPKMFDGVRKLTPAAQTMYAGINGGAVSFTLLDELKDMNTADHIMIDNFGYPVKAYDGTPVIINDFLTADESRGTSSVTCSIYAMRLNEADGFHGLFGGAAAGFRMEKVGLLQGKDATRYRMKWYAAAALKSTQSLSRLAGVTNI
jgi:hypothetical protein